MINDKDKYVKLKKCARPSVASHLSVRSSFTKSVASHEVSSQSRSQSVCYNMASKVYSRKLLHNDLSVRPHVCPHRYRERYRALRGQSAWSFTNKGRIASVQHCGAFCSIVIYKLMCSLISKALAKSLANVLADTPLMPKELANVLADTKSDR